jgi:hypothetical protein
MASLVDRTVFVHGPAQESFKLPEMQNYVQKKFEVFGPNVVDVRPYHDPPGAFVTFACSRQAVMALEAIYLKGSQCNWHIVPMVGNRIMEFTDPLQACHEATARKVLENNNNELDRLEADRWWKAWSESDPIEKAKFFIHVTPCLDEYSFCLMFSGIMKKLALDASFPSYSKPEAKPWAFGFVDISGKVAIFERLGNLRFQGHTWQISKAKPKLNAKEQKAT